MAKDDQLPYSSWSFWCFMQRVFDQIYRQFLTGTHIIFHSLTYLYKIAVYLTI